MLSLGFIELLLIFGIVFGLGFWQLWSVSRDIKASKERHDDDN